jgi:hypothetical protein
MQTKVSPVFSVFEKSHQEAIQLFFELSKRIRSKKAGQLYDKLLYLELFADLIGKIHFEQKELSNQLIRDFRPLEKDLKKIIRLKAVEQGLEKRQSNLAIRYNSYEQFIQTHKRGLHKVAFDRIVGSTTSEWSQLLDQVKKSSKGLKVLEVSTAIHQLVQDELEFFELEWKKGMDSRAYKDLHLGLQKIMKLEQLLGHLGLNPIFIARIHTEMEQMIDSLDSWYVNHLEIQFLSQFLAEKPKVSQKYLDWAKELKQKKKGLSSVIEKQASQLFAKILG